MLQRKILLLLTLAYPLFGGLFNYTKSNFDDLRIRILISGFVFLAYKLSKKRVVRLRKIPNLIPYLAFNLIVYHSMYLLIVNSYKPEYLVQISAMIFFTSLGFYRKYDLLYYLFFVLLMLTPFTVTILTKLDIYYILCVLLLVAGISFYIQNTLINYLKQLLSNDKSLMRSIDSVTDAVIITDTEYFILYANDLATKILDFGQEFLIGSKLSIPIPTETRLTGKISRILTTDEKRLFEVRMIKIERESRPAFFIILKDITEDEKVKFEIERKRILNESILESMYDSVLGINKDGKIIYSNTESKKLLAKENEEILDLDFHENFHHTWIDGNQHEKDNSPIWETLLEQKRNRIHNEIFWNKKDSSIPVEYTSTPLKHPNMEGGSVVVFRDNTEKKRIEKIERNYKDGLSFLSDSAMKFLQLNSIQEIYSYATETLKNSFEIRGVILTIYNEKENFETVSVSGFKLIQTSIMKVLKSELIGIEYKVEESRLINFQYSYNKLYFLPDGLYSINFGYINRKDSLIIESLLNVKKVYTVTLFDEKIYGSLILLFSEEDKIKESVIEIFSSQLLIALKKFSL